MELPSNDTRENTVSSQSEENPLDLTKHAAQYFTHASIEYPASIAGQSCAIAFLCKQKSQSPNELLDMLIHNEERLLQIVHTANKVHTAKENGPTDFRGRLKKVYLGKLKDILHEDFTRAEKMMILDTEEIQNLKEYYIVFKMKVETRRESEKRFSQAKYQEMKIEEEDIYRQFIDDMIKAKYQELNP